MRREKGSAAIYVFVAVMTVVVILLSILIGYSNKRKSQLIETKQLQNIYDRDMNEIYSSIVTPITITYNANGGSGTMNATQRDNSAVVDNNSFTAPANKVFGEWNTASNGSGTTYLPGEIVTSDVTLYAIWQTGMKLVGVANNVGVAKKAETLTEYYTKSVDSTFFTSNEGNDWTWQLFYDDENYIFLIASDYVPNSKLPMNGNTGFGTTDLIKSTKDENDFKDYCAFFASNSSFNDSIYTPGTIYNNGSASTAITNNRLSSRYLKWASTYSSSTNVNIKATAFMMDTSKWSAFAGSQYTVSGKEAQAIGGPTIELFGLSYNSVGTNPIELETYSTITSSNATSTGYIRSSSATSANSLGSTSNMWCIHEATKAYCYWIASPTDQESEKIVMMISSNGWISGYIANSNRCGFRPVVSIPKSAIL